MASGVEGSGHLGPPCLSWRSPIAHQYELFPKPGLELEASNTPPFILLSFLPPTSSEKLKVEPAEAAVSLASGKSPSYSPGLLQGARGLGSEGVPYGSLLLRPTAHHPSPLLPDQSTPSFLQVPPPHLYSWQEDESSFLSLHNAGDIWYHTLWKSDSTDFRARRKLGGDPVPLSYE